MDKIKTYILEEHIMNGTVTLRTIINGIKAKDFEEAVNIVKLLPNFLKHSEIINETDNSFSYRIVQEFTVHGHLNFEPLNIINSSYN